MITTKSDLQEYLRKDKVALGVTRKRPHSIGDYVWKFQIALRKYEYYINVKPRSALRLYWKLRHYRLGIKLGLSIPPNVCGAGLRINHYGLIVVNPNATIGEWCDIHQGVNIGTDFDGNCPTIGSNVWIGPGAKVYGDITLGDGVVVGANAVVNKSFDSGTVAGVPAKRISDKANPYWRR